MARVAVVGAGAIGSYFAAQLLRQHEVFLCGRQSRPGFVLNGQWVPLPTITKSEQLPAIDFTLLAVKTYDSVAAAGWIQSPCVLLQNGLAPEELMPALAWRVVPAVVHVFVERLDSGRFQSRPVSPDLSLPEALPIFSGCSVEVESDFFATRWRKALLNLAANPLTALAGAGLEIFHQAQWRELATALINEAAIVAAKEGVPMRPEIATEVLARLAAYPAGTTTSMQQDAAAGRPLEVAALTGALLRKAARLGLALPVNEAVMARMADFSSTRQHPATSQE
jgi:2-dehydropantoate 2-reductase